MVEAKNSDEDIGYKFGILLPGLSNAHMGRPGLRSKIKSLVDSKSRKVDVVFGAILNVATEVILHIFGRYRVIVNISMNGMILFAQVR